MADQSKEPVLEIVVGHFIPAENGSFLNARSTRHLHLVLPEDSADKRRVLEFVAEPKGKVNKSDLAGSEPSQEVVLGEVNVRVLVRWLRARYDRATFPDAFVERLTEASDAIEKAVKPLAKEIHGVYFLHDPDGEITDVDEPYFLSIYLVYDTDVDGASRAAAEAARRIKDRFERCYKTKETPNAGFQWTKIELGECEAVADVDVSFRSLLDLKMYRLDHVSLRNVLPAPLSDAA